jgi:hypothetical protein
MMLTQNTDWLKTEESTVIFEKFLFTLELATFLISRKSTGLMARPS